MSSAEVHFEPGALPDVLREEDEKPTTFCDRERDTITTTLRDAIITPRRPASLCSPRLRGPMRCCGDKWADLPADHESTLSSIRLAPPGVPAGRAHRAGAILMARSKHLSRPAAHRHRRARGGVGTRTDAPLLQLAPCTAPYANEAGGIANNERPEFPGRPVLSIIIAQKLYEQYPDVAESDLSRMRAATVSQQPLSRAAARRIGLGDFVFLGRVNPCMGTREGLDPVRHLRGTHRCDLPDQRIGGRRVESFLSACVSCWWTLPRAAITRPEDPSRRVLTV